MATAPTYPSASGPIAVATRLAESDSTNIVDVIDNSAGTTAIKVEALNVTTDNTADRILKLHLYSGAVSHLLGSRTIADLSGTNGATDPRVDMMALLGKAGADGVQCIWVPAGTKLQASLDAALASGKYLYITGRAITYGA